MKRGVYSAIIIIISIILLSMLFLSFNKKTVEKMNLTSPVFENNGNIPSKYSCDGKNVSPPLSISKVPENAKSLVLIVDDPDAPSKTWVHWILWNIPKDTGIIEENKIPNGAVQGVNDFGKNNYDGPCPPSGIHRYFFKLYALDSVLELSKNSGKQDTEEAMKKHIIAEAKLIGKYSRE